jgi:hypothetical protein
MRKVIWSLFDSETATVAKTFPEHEVYSFGIGGGTEHIHLDLSNFDTAKKELDKYPKPAYIFASPPCETWVNVSVGQKRFYTKENGYNLYWKNKWTPFDFTPKHREKRINGENTVATTAKIIQYYKPKCWAIENGNSSLLFSYIYEFNGLSGFLNKCRYSNYKANVIKPTIIKSNKMLILLNSPRKDVGCHIKKIEELRGKDRSIVPPLLYKDILRQFEHGGQKTLFPMEAV